MRLAGKAAFITGAASGIGRATALTFAREGARVTVCDVDEAGGQATTAMITSAGGEAIFALADVSDEAQVAQAIAAAVERMGRLDVLCNIAGIGEEGGHVRAAELPLAVLRRVMQVNLEGVFLCCKHALPHLITSKRGAIVNMASIAGMQAGMIAPITAYGPSKAAVLGLTTQLAVQYAPEGVRVNAVCPGPVNTPILVPLMSPEVSRIHRERTPLGKAGDPQDIANVCLFLASDEAAHITGAFIVVDGGITAT